MKMMISAATMMIREHRKVIIRGQLIWASAKGLEEGFSARRLPPRGRAGR